MGLAALTAARVLPVRLAPSVRALFPFSGRKIAIAMHEGVKLGLFIGWYWCGV